MKALGAKEALEITKANEDSDYSDVLCKLVAAAIVYPNLKDAELVKAFASKNNGKIMKPHEILLELVNAGEYNKLIGIYNKQNEATMDFPELIEEAKN